jgi:hypothetical protein
MFLTPSEHTGGHWPFYGHRNTRKVEFSSLYDKNVHFSITLLGSRPMTNQTQSKNLTCNHRLVASCASVSFRQPQASSPQLSCSLQLPTLMLHVFDSHSLDAFSICLASPSTASIRLAEYLIPVRSSLSSRFHSGTIGIFLLLTARYSSHCRHRNVFWLRKS